MATKDELQAIADQEIDDAKPMYKQVNNLRSEFSSGDYAQAKIDLGNSKWEAQQFGYVQARQEAYGSIGDQLDLLYHDMTASKGDKTGEWYKAIKAVKDANPKPQQLTKLQEMRLIALDRANNRCEWPECINYDQRLELAHLKDIGMGGNPTRKYDIDNVAMLCKLHHDIYDGRTISYSKREHRLLLKSYLDYARQ